MARKTEMDKIVQTVNDPLGWFQSATSLTGALQIYPVDHSSRFGDGLEEKDEADDTREADTDAVDASNNDGQSHVENQAPSNHKKEGLENDCSKSKN